LLERQHYTKKAFLCGKIIDHEACNKNANFLVESLQPYSTKHKENLSTIPQRMVEQKSYERDFLHKGSFAPRKILKKG
jgi:hypothetical protein